MDSLAYDLLVAIRKSRPHANTVAASMLLDDQLCFALYSAAHAIQKRYRPLLRQLGLTYPQYLVLLVLWECDELSVSDIGERLFLNSATLTPLLKRMERAGLIDRRRSSADERQVVVHLTRAGATLRNKAERVTTDVTCAAGLAVEDPGALLRSVVELRDGLGDETRS